MMEEVVQTAISIRRRVPLHTKQDLLPFYLRDALSPPSRFFATDADFLISIFPPCYLHNSAYYLRNDGLGVRHPLIKVSFFLLIVHFKEKKRKKTVQKSAWGG